MQIDITFKNLDSSDALKEYAAKRLSKIDKYIDRTAEAHVVFSVEKRRHKADVTVNADGTVINAVEITEDLYAAIDMVMDKLERQIKKYKQKLQGKKGQSKSFPESTGTPSSTETKPRIIHEKGYFIKPMSVEEAALQIDVVEKEFIIFLNTETNQINLIYRRQDGDLGLIEPTP
ncbi:MAG TPA: ribosome-associated translation inhibitor RaiA [Deltaproteobacteria bacterium]|nr:ribosome-associated translation inhibitor RaiA [Deltaproteobacteria bacterium]